RFCEWRLLRVVAEVNLQQVDGDAKQAFDAPHGAPDIDPCRQRDFIERLEPGVQAVTISQADENLDVEEPLRDKRLTKDDRGGVAAKELRRALPVIHRKLPDHTGERR